MKKAIPLMALAIILAMTSLTMAAEPNSVGSPSKNAPSIDKQLAAPKGNCGPNGCNAAAPVQTRASTRQEFRGRLMERPVLGILPRLFSKMRAGACCN